MAPTGAGVLAIVGWFAVVGQYFATDVEGFAGTVNYFSYFTILSNILVAATLTAAALAPDSRVGRFLLRPPVAMATMVYITVTALTYYVMLASLYRLEGWARHFDHILHYAMPPAFLLFWLVAVPKGGLRFGAIVWVLVPPFVYGAWTLLHGALSGFWPYPFVDAAKIGYLDFFRNVAIFGVFFAVVATFYILIDRLLGRHGWSRSA
ncbi:MAG: Pr6Pr family membrane protein [Bauldia sp.]|uniref:Pr6Pr family membrane protein n=1 Tax=Bauldia sp. TaxID=2575872 RepID=UPI001DAD8D45|nr:Pr6Pr family membrane protein [Bauldia sp.]MCB1496137.1 Pr6Pr family membrane protein [Bauldia sp.]